MLERLCVIGVGLIGGSVALAARRAGLVRRIAGVDSNPEALCLARSLGVIDEAETRVEEGVRGADSVVIAAPVGAMRQVLAALAPVWSRQAFYTDVGSTKASVIVAAEAVFGEVPDNFIPAHPIAGRELSGVQAASPDLFNGKRVILTPAANADPEALKRVRLFWQELGAKVDSMSAVHHDHVLAATSHLPHAVAYALVHLLGRQDEKDEIFRYAAGGFGDFTRIAGSDPKMWADICLANAEEIVSWMLRFEQELRDLREKIEDREGRALREYFGAAKTFRQRFLEQYRDKS
ncbi:MAG: prephenate dehydrogenase/arogenate dehydrogenase family protein [Methylohalobius sp.]|nr:prephenate dehydrogenase/arogenate dehydrogenase family protein [Methylohalobius sp.]